MGCSGTQWAPPPLQRGPPKPPRDPSNGTLQKPRPLRPPPPLPQILDPPLLLVYWYTLSLVFLAWPCLVLSGDYTTLPAQISIGLGNGLAELVVVYTAGEERRGAGIPGGVPGIMSHVMGGGPRGSRRDGPPIDDPEMSRHLRGMCRAALPADSGVRQRAGGMKRTTLLIIDHHTTYACIIHHARFERVPHVHTMDKTDGEVPCVCSSPVLDLYRMHTTPPESTIHKKSAKMKRLVVTDEQIYNPLMWSFPWHSTSCYIIICLVGIESPTW